MSILMKIFMKKRDKKLLGLAVVANDAIQAAKLRKKTFKHDSIQWNKIGLLRVSADRAHYGPNKDGKIRFVPEYSVTIGGASPDALKLRSFVHKYIREKVDVYANVVSEW